MPAKKSKKKSVDHRDELIEFQRAEIERLKVTLFERPYVEAQRERDKNEKTQRLMQGQAGIIDAVLGKKDIQEGKLKRIVNNSDQPEVDPHANVRNGEYFVQPKSEGKKAKNPIEIDPTKTTNIKTGLGVSEGKTFNVEY